MNVHQIWIGPNPLPPRLAAYCETIRKAFPDAYYRLWDEERIAGVASRAIIPEAFRPGHFPIGIRADIIRLEILHQFGGVYFDTDFEALRPDLRPVFEYLPGFLYSDELSGRPTNSVLYASEPLNPFVRLLLDRIQARLPDTINPEHTVNLTGPGRIAECLNFRVANWNKLEPYVVEGTRIGSHYAQGSITGLWREFFFPYHYSKDTWATFDPRNHRYAWAAHHWEGAWHR